MAVTALLVFQGHNNLRYRITAGGESVPGGSVTIPNNGGVSPDLQTDTLAGALKRIARARLDGIGTIPAGTPLSANQARAILLADDSTSVGGLIVARARCAVTGRDVAGWSVDAGVDGQGDPVVTVNALEDGIAYLDIEMIGGIAQ
jgi:hypothetical protein